MSARRNSRLKRSDPDPNAPVPDSVSPPASAGREYSPPGPAPAGESSDPAETISAQQPSQPQRGEEDEMPSTSFRDDLEHARARRSNSEPPERIEHSLPPARASGIARPDNLGLEIDYAHLERKRRERAELDR
jgi:hypothetical protein